MSLPLLRSVRKPTISALLVLFSLLAAAQQQPSRTAFVVVVPVANMFSAPSQDTDVVSQAIYGANVTALENQGDWVKIRTDDEYTGWARLADLAKRDGAPYGSSGKAVQISGFSANLYREPNVTKHAPLLTLPFDSVLEVTKERVADGDRWMQVQLPDGRSAYVQNGDVTAQGKPLAIPETIALAKKFLGVTYTWGGSSSFGYDCSGFMQMLVRHRGVVMPRDADLQAAWSGVVPVERKDLQPGDLLYFGSSAQKITHTGMYIGDGLFIHDTTNTHPMVQISKLDDMPWTRLLVAQRRLK